MTVPSRGVVPSCSLISRWQKLLTLQLPMVMVLMMMFLSPVVTATTASPTNLNTMVDLRHDPSGSDQDQIKVSKSSAEVSNPISSSKKTTRQQQQQQHDILPDPLSYQQSPDGLNIVQSYHWFLLLHDLRAGARYDYPDEDDEYDDEDFDEEGEYDDEDDEEIMRPGDYRRRPPPSTQTRNNNHRHPPPLPNKKYRKKRQQHWTQRMASKSLSIGSSMVFGAAKQSGKLVYNIAKPKKVSLHEINGLWRIDQQVTLGPKNAPNPKILVSVATITLDSRKRILIVKDAAAATNTKNDRKDDDNTNENKKGGKAQQQPESLHRPFQFTKTRLGSYKTEFVAPAFLIGDKPRWYGYRGTWQRKLADPKVIKLVGKIYIVRKQRFGKDKGKFLFGQPVGTFVARRRVQIEDDDDDDHIDEGEYDEYDDNDEGKYGDEYDNDGDGFGGGYDEDLTEGYDSDYHEF